MFRNSDISEYCVILLFFRFFSVVTTSFHRYRLCVGKMETEVSNRIKLNAEEKIEGPSLLHDMLSDMILADILLYVDKRSLSSSCVGVCRKWHSIIAQSDSFWLEKCLFDHIPIPPPQLRGQHPFNYHRIAMKQPFGRNLVRNPSGEGG